MGHITPHRSLLNYYFPFGRQAQEHSRLERLKNSGNKEKEILFEVHMGMYVWLEKLPFSLEIYQYEKKKGKRYLIRKWCQIYSLMCLLEIIYLLVTTLMTSRKKKKKKDMKWYICLVWLLISKNLQQNAINWNRNLCKVFIGVLSGKWSTTCKVSSEIDI